MEKNGLKKDRALLSSSVKALMGISVVEACKSRSVREIYWQHQPLANYTLRMNLWHQLLGVGGCQGQQDLI